MSEDRDYYELLGLDREASPEEVRRAYHQVARRLHPDVNRAAGETELFLDIQKAYEVLADPDKRKKYDRKRTPANIERDTRHANKLDIHLTTLYSRSFLPSLNEPQVVYTLMSITPPADWEYYSPPLNICLVIDRSTSMSGARLDMVKITVLELLRQLRPEDTLAIVAFSDRAEVLVPASRHFQPHKLASKIQMLAPGGGTEIYQGLKAGFDEIRFHHNAEIISHIILLTDGHTYGDEDACKQLATRAVELGIGLSIFGIGDDWNDVFLDDLAHRTGGSSEYIADPGEIKGNLIEKIQGLGQVYAENVKFEFALEVGTGWHQTRGHCCQKRLSMPELFPRRDGYP